MPYIHIRCVVSIVKETQAQREMQQLLRNTTAGRRWGGSATCLLTYLYIRRSLLLFGAFALQTNLCILQD